MAVFDSLCSLIVEIEAGVLDGTGMLSPATTQKLESILGSLKSQEFDEEKEYQLTDRLYAFMRKRYFDGDETTRVNVSDNAKLHVVFDLDDCLIRSAHISEGEAKELYTTVVERTNGVTGTKIEHVDDDLIRYTTVLRRFTRLLLTLLSPFCFLYVFTSASRGYMTNVVSLIEAGFPKGTEMLKKENVLRKYQFFEAKRVSSTDLQDSLRLVGKNVKHLVPEEALGKAILVDDVVAYHQAQPIRGLQIKKFKNGPGEDPDKNQADRELLNLLPLFLKAAMLAGVEDYEEKIPDVITRSQSDAYWKELMIYVLKMYGKEKGGIDVSSDDLVWKEATRILDEFARSHEVINHRKPSPWRRDLNRRWKQIIKNEQKTFVKTIKSAHKKHQVKLAVASKRVTLANKRVSRPLLS